MPFYENQPTIYPLHRLLDELVTGEVRVPRFQRPGTESTWKPQQRRDLLDSIYRGFPIGTILLWSTNETVHTLPVVGGAEIPVASTTGRKLRLILDGHQRLSTLISILGAALDNYKPTKLPALIPREVWVFDVSGDDQIGERDDRFKLLRDGEKPGAKQVPLAIALDRVKLNEWVRKQKNLVREEVRRVDNLRDRLREFNIPVATLAAESLDEATETFKRVNSSGTPMSDFHMVAALAYTNQFDPQEQFERVRAELLEPEGWGEIDNADVLRVCAGLIRRKGDASQHPAKLDIVKLGKALRNDSTLIEEAGRSVAAAAAVLRTAVGVHGAEALPYSWQLIVLAIELGSRGSKALLKRELSQCARWFWLTTYGSVFAGVNSAVVDRAARSLGEMLSGKNEAAMQRDIGRRVEEPSRFDFRAARSRACLLAMAREQDKDDLNGKAHRALVEGAQAVQTLSPKVGRSVWYNLVIDTELEHLRVLRDALRHRASGERVPGEMESLSRLSIHRNDSGNIDQLLELRRSRLMAFERTFVESLGLDWKESLEG